MTPHAHAKIGSILAAYMAACLAGPATVRALRPQVGQARIGGHSKRGGVHPSLSCRACSHTPRFEPFHPGESGSTQCRPGPPGIRSQ